MDKFKVDYDKKTLTLFFEGNQYEFDLTKGDIGEFWHGFETVDGVNKDLNFYQEDENEQPSVCVYGVWVDEHWHTDFNDEVLITECETIGNPLNYFDFTPKEEKTKYGQVVQFGLDVALPEGMCSSEVSQFLKKRLVHIMQQEVGALIINGTFDSEDMEHFYDIDEVNKIYSK